MPESIHIQTNFLTGIALMRCQLNNVKKTSHLLLVSYDLKTIHHVSLQKLCFMREIFLLETILFYLHSTYRIEHILL